MTRLEKIAALASMYECSLQGVRVLIQKGHISGAYGIEHKKRWSYFFSPELTQQIERMERK